MPKLYRLDEDRLGLILEALQLTTTTLERRVDEEDDAIARAFTSAAREYDKLRQELKSGELEVRQ